MKSLANRSRACFKEIPDNLIFHLKRFDYDVMTGMRSKINDIFEFPRQIDMTPYHVDYQKDANLPCPSDMFELVGVLVHSGTAESGHYYSYIRERPSNAENTYPWVEFNDVDVTKWDPSNIADQCFGGFTESHTYGHRFQKNWNAYMLFYERIEPRSPNSVALSMVSNVPAKCPLQPEIEQQVAFSNAQYLRRYCLYDPAHAAFARQFLEQLREVNKGTCSEDHAIEQEAIWLSLDYLEQVLSRSKDSSDFAKMLASLTKVIGSCAVCCRLALDWVKSREHSLRNLLLRCPNPKVRKDFASMIVLALQYLKKYEPQWYGFQDTGSMGLESSMKELHHSGMFAQIVARLAELWGVLLTNSRGWDDYFGLLNDLANFGAHEIHVLLNRMFLKDCLEVLTLCQTKASRLRSDTPNLAQYCRLVDKGRKFSLSKLVELFATLLDKIDFSAQPRVQARRFHPEGMSLNRMEDELLQMGSDMTRPKNVCAFLDKILNLHVNQETIRRIVKTITLAEPQFGMLQVIQRTIVSGISVEPAALAEPYLHAAIGFCEAAPMEANVEQMIRYIAEEVDTIGETGGQEHVTFFSQARRVVNVRNNFEPAFISRAVLRSVPQWAPPLLLFKDESVRSSTLDLLKHLIFCHDLRTMDDEEHADLIETAAKDLQVACTRRCTSLVRLQQPIIGSIVEQIMSVIRHCLTHYYDVNEDQRPVAEADSKFQAFQI